MLNCVFMCCDTVQEEAEGICLIVSLCSKLFWRFAVRNKRINNSYHYPLFFFPEVRISFRTSLQKRFREFLQSSNDARNASVIKRLTLNIPNLARQRCLSSRGPRRTPWFFCNFSTVWCGRLLRLCFLGFWNYNSVIQALLASNILCLFISTEVSQ